ncbi:hypothetical protein ACLWBD_06155 [Bdellovibrio sp. HCB117]|uniref:Uncharacterized protein n=1 Tax=Bdellovibrio bacteriovorus TaxID=959 RepID=A0A150WUK2_BDEBC|nr:hypothetical protein [Bdellovibrio bacteriovorus]KYG69962.1 hypothetical protein AZI85_14765 [Bdellovibrio bacteriovorus]
MRNFAVFVFLLIASSSAFADLAESFEKIKSHARHYRDPGAVCEEVAQIEFSELYPAPQYEVIVGVAYNVKGRTVGELDMVLMDKNTQKVAMVGEVKCYTDLKNGLKKAKQQRKRFLTVLGSGQKIDFVNTSSGEKYDYEQFQYVTQFISVSQKGGKAVGFDYELEHTLDEMSQLRDQVIHCQKDGLCPRPQ